MLLASDELTDSSNDSPYHAGATWLFVCLHVFPSQALGSRHPEYRIGGDRGRSHKQYVVVSDIDIQGAETVASPFWKTAR